MWKKYQTGKTIVLCVVVLFISTIFVVLVQQRKVHRHVEYDQPAVSTSPVATTLAQDWLDEPLEQRLKKNKVALLRELEVYSGESSLVECRGVQPDIESILQSYLVRLIKEHQMPHIHRDYANMLGSRSICVAIMPMREGYRAGFTVVRTGDQKYMLVMNYNVQAMLAETPRRLQISIWHEYCHYLQFSKGKYPREIFVFGSQFANDNKDMWFEIENEAHLLTSFFAIQQGAEWVAEISTADQFLVGAMQALQVAMDDSSVRFPEKEKMAIELGSRDRFRVQAVIMNLITSEGGSAELERIRNACKWVGSSTMRAFLADDYVRIKLLTPEQGHKLRCTR